MPRISASQPVDEVRSNVDGIASSSMLSRTAVLLSRPVNHQVNLLEVVQLETLPIIVSPYILKFVSIPIMPFHPVPYLILVPSHEGFAYDLADNVHDLRALYLVSLKSHFGCATSKCGLPYCQVRAIFAHFSAVDYKL